MSETSVQPRRFWLLWSASTATNLGADSPTAARPRLLMLQSAASNRPKPWINRVLI
jgi:hypothetical protein